jgi:hypothetical protein
VFLGYTTRNKNKYHYSSDYEKHPAKSLELFLAPLHTAETKVLLHLGSLFVLLALPFSCKTRQGMLTFSF